MSGSSSKTHGFSTLLVAINEGEVGRAVRRDSPWWTDSAWARRDPDRRAAQNSDYLLTGEVPDSREAARIGLVSQCVPHGEVLPHALEMLSLLHPDATEGIRAAVERRPARFPSAGL
jgi:hypothetical protein